MVSLAQFDDALTSFSEHFTSKYEAYASCSLLNTMFSATQTCSYARTIQEVNAKLLSTDLAFRSNNDDTEEINCKLLSLRRYVALSREQRDQILQSLIEKREVLPPSQKPELREAMSCYIGRYEGSLFVPSKDDFVLDGECFGHSYNGDLIAQAVKWHVRQTNILTNNLFRAFKNSKTFASRWKEHAEFCKEEIKMLINGESFYSNELELEHRMELATNIASRFAHLEALKILKRHLFSRIATHNRVRLSRGSNTLLLTDVTDDSFQFVAAHLSSGTAKTLLTTCKRMQNVQAIKDAVLHFRIRESHDTFPHQMLSHDRNFVISKRSISIYVDFGRVMHGTLPNNNNNNTPTYTPDPTLMSSNQRRRTNALKAAKGPTAALDKYNHFKTSPFPETEPPLKLIKLYCQLVYADDNSDVSSTTHCSGLVLSAKMRSNEGCFQEGVLSSAPRDTVLPAVCKIQIPPENCSSFHNNSLFKIRVDVIRGDDKKHALHLYSSPFLVVSKPSVVDTASKKRKRPA
jgi:hypothetical protein